VQTAFSLFQGGTPGTFPEAAFYSFPRLGFDYVLVPNVTIGGNILFYSTLGGHHTTEQTSANGQSMSLTYDSPSALIFGLAPRGGYILPLNDLFSLWLRGGLSFFTSSVKTTDANGSTHSNSTNQLALDLDPQIVFLPLPHLGITAGLTADIPLAGGHSTTDTSPPGVSITDSAGSSMFYLGAELGILGWL